jgi:hypothetical protein
MHIQILDLISWHRETNLFHTHLTIIKKSIQMLEVPKLINNYCMYSIQVYILYINISYE